MIVDRIHRSSTTLPASPLVVLLMVVAPAMEINQCCPVPAGCGVRRCISACCAAVTPRSVRAAVQSAAMPAAARLALAAVQVARRQHQQRGGVGSVLQLPLVPLQLLR